MGDVKTSAQQKLIVLPGTINCPFFLNEISYLKAAFDDLFIISYQEKRHLCDEIAKKYNIRYQLISNRKISVSRIIEFLKWIAGEEVKREIREEVTISPNGLKKLVYICWYGWFASEVSLVMKKELNSTGSKVILYSYWLSRPAYAIALFHKTRNDKINKIISRAHRYDLYYDRNTLGYLPFRRFINDNLDCIYFISEDGKDFYSAWERDCKIDKRIEKRVSYLGTFNVRNYKKIIKDKKYISMASCSSLIPVKRIDLIIDVLSRLKTPIRWIHIGDGFGMESLKSLAKDKLREGAYHFLGRIENEKILECYRDNDVDFFINLSDSEGIPVSMMEALSSGIPVIARRVGGIAEIINENTGLLLEEGKKSEELSEIIESFIMIRLCDIEKYQIISDNAIKAWEKKFSAETNYKEFINTIKENEI